MLANWLSGCWSVDGSPVDVVFCLPDGHHLSVHKHYLEITGTEDTIGARVHSGMVCLHGVTIVAKDTKTLVPGVQPVFGGPGVFFLVFKGTDWVLHGPETLLGGGVGVFWDGEQPDDRLVYDAFRRWVRELDFGPHVDAWIEALSKDDRWKLE